MKTLVLRDSIHLCFVFQLSFVRIHCLQMRNVGMAAPRILAPNPVSWVRMIDVAACVMSNPLTFLRGIQSFRMFHQIYSLLNTPPHFGWL